MTVVLGKVHVVGMTTLPLRRSCPPSDDHRVGDGRGQLGVCHLSGDDVHRAQNNWGVGGGKKDRNALRSDSKYGIIVTKNAPLF